MRSRPLPTPPQQKNHGNYVVSLGAMCAWLAEKAEALEVDIFPGYAGIRPQEGRTPSYETTVEVI